MHGTFADAECGLATAHGAGVPHFLRSHGAIDLSFKRRGGATAIDRSGQSGNLRLRLPRPDRASEVPTAVLINTAGGVAEGDSLDYRLVWQSGTAAIATTQAAEKVYRAPTSPARIGTRIEVDTGAAAEWLPQETIVFDGCRLERDAKVLLADGASFLGVEALVFGRGASGEVVLNGTLRDRLRIWRGGRLVYADALVLDGDIDRLMRRSGIGAGARALAVLIHAADDAAQAIVPVRAALADAKGRAAASTWNDLLAVRLIASDGETLRHDIALALAPLRQGRPLPRVWGC